MISTSNRSNNRIRRHTGDKTRLLNFVKQNAMPWPPYFDGKRWKNEISSKHGINLKIFHFIFFLGRAGTPYQEANRSEKMLQS